MNINLKLPFGSTHRNKSCTLHFVPFSISSQETSSLDCSALRASVAEVAACVAELSVRGMGRAPAALRVHRAQLVLQAHPDLLARPAQQVCPPYPSLCLHSKSPSLLPAGTLNKLRVRAGVFFTILQPSYTTAAEDESLCPMQKHVFPELEFGRVVCAGPIGPQGPQGANGTCSDDQCNSAHS